MVADGRIAPGSDPDPDLERRRPAPAGHRHWVERHRLLISARDDARWLVVAAQISVHPAAGRASFQAVVVEPERRPVVLSESDLQIPARGWELRGSGLWTAHQLETPFRHWSYGLEAFALVVDDPWELLGAGLGERIPLGWELDFESDDQPEPAPTLRPAQTETGFADGGYRQRGMGHGLVLIGRREIDIEGAAVRSHRWGGPGADLDQVGPDPAGPEPGDVAPLGPTPVCLPVPDGVWSVTVGPDGGVSADTVPAAGPGLSG